MRCTWVLAVSSSWSISDPVVRGGWCPQRGSMVRIASALGLVMFSVALLILSLISYVSIKKDFLLSTPRYGPNGGPRMSMFHTGFRSQLAMKYLDPAFTSLTNALSEDLQNSSKWSYNSTAFMQLKIRRIRSLYCRFTRNTVKL